LLLVLLLLELVLLRPTVLATPELYATLTVNAFTITSVLSSQLHA